MPNSHRRDLSGERRQEILDAFRLCVARDGLQASSLRRIAAEVGLSQSVLMHHFGSRDGLVQALLDFLVARYDDALEASFEVIASERGVDSLLEFLLGGGFTAVSERDQGLFTELHATAARDENLSGQLKKVYRRLLSRIKGELAKAFPSADPKRVREVGYALMCLAEGDDLCRGIGVPGRRNRDALAMGRVLVGTLS